MPSSSTSAKPKKCPICGKPSVEAYQPFCSKRCADIDLAKWFSGSYAIAGRPEDEGDGAERSDKPEPDDPDE
jgi:endogenous inhibitor of DNA gyrase (YacG/DUF329 family)